MSPLDVTLPNNIIDTNQPVQDETTSMAQERTALSETREERNKRRKERIERKKESSATWSHPVDFKKFQLGVK
jgi:hypothetical protein